MSDSAEDIARDVAAVARIEAVPTLLRVLCESTGMRFVAVARVTDQTWTACAVLDNIEFGLKPGGQLELNTTLCNEVRKVRTPIIIDKASTDPVYANHHTPRLYQIESYISVPIVFSDGNYFGNLCAIDPQPAKLSAPHILSMFNHFAALIALQLENERNNQLVHAALLDERSASELREQFIAVLGHDLRTPLAAVSAGADVLQHMMTDPIALNVAANTKRSVKRMSALINDVLDFARGRLGDGIGVHLEEVQDIDQALSAVVAEIQEAHPDRIISVKLDADTVVRCDRTRIQQVASNLLSNAVAHGLRSSPIRFTSSLEDDTLVLEIWNDGDPIPSDSMDKIFAPFWRHSTGPEREGLGLGLFICTQIVNAHNGQLIVDSKKGRGTLFTVRLPICINTPAEA